MPEVFTVILLTAWPHDRKIIHLLNASLSCFIRPIYQNLPLICYRIKCTIIEKLLAVLFAAMCFALPENKHGKGVIYSRLLLRMINGPGRYAVHEISNEVECKSRCGLASNNL